MSDRFIEGYCPLASGSKGNATYFGSDKARILIDAGLSMKATQEKLQSIGVNLSEIHAILISHEHVDHMRGAVPIATKYNIPVLTNVETAHAIVDSVDKMQTKIPTFKLFSTNEPFEFKGLEIHPFSIPHDAADPVAFAICTPRYKFGICTDLGFATPAVKNYLKGCNYLIIESNHDEGMLKSSSRSELHKQRVLSNQGHLSNTQCAELIAAIARPELKHIHLAHLSEECNHPTKALETSQKVLNLMKLSIPISIAHQHQVSVPVHLEDLRRLEDEIDLEIDLVDYH